MPSIRECITQYDWQDILTVAFVLIDDAHRDLPQDARLTRQRGGRPKFSDSEVITLTFVCEWLFRGNEKLMLAFIHNYHADLFLNLLERTRFNRRRRALHAVIERLRRVFTDLQGLWTDPHRVVDSVPITQCGWRRRHRCALMRGEEWQGYVAAKKQHFFGMRLHLTTNLLGLVDRWLLAPAALDEREVLPLLVTDDQPRLFLADGGYISDDLAHLLSRQAGHRLLALRRRNQKLQWVPDLRRIVKSLRHWIETASSVLDNVFSLEHPNAKSDTGFIARIGSKLFAYNFAFVLQAVLACTFNY
jgi:DDE family transposase